MPHHNGKTHAGRGGNDIASALTQMLYAVVKQQPAISELILWGDSCVPQNRNSLMSLALIRFLSKQTALQKITQKFCEPGHSSIQEVDNIHSQIERNLRCTEVFSPLGVVRLMLAVNRRKPITVLQMKTGDFMEFRDTVKSLRFSDIPYSKVKVLLYSKDLPCCIKYKTSFTHTEFVNVCLLHGCNCNLHEPGEGCEFQKKFMPNVDKLKKPELVSGGALTKQKVADIQSMYPYMPQVDREFMQSVISAVQHHDDTTSNPSCDPKDNAVRGSSTRQSSAAVRVSSTRQSSDAVRGSSTSSVRKKQ